MCCGTHQGVPERVGSTMKQEPMCLGHLEVENRTEPLQMRVAGYFQMPLSKGQREIFAKVNNLN